MNDGKISPIPEPVTPSEHDFIILAKRTPSILDDEDEKQL